MIDHDPLCPGDMHDAWCECSFIAKVRADERERIAQAIEAEKVDPKAQGRLTVENRDYPLTRDDILIINGTRNRDAQIARNGGN